MGWATTMDKELQEFADIVKKERDQGRKVTPEFLLRQAASNLIEGHKEKLNTSAVVYLIYFMISLVVLSYVFITYSIPHMKESPSWIPVYILSVLWFFSSLGFMLLKFYYNKVQTNYDELYNLVLHYIFFYGQKDLTEDQIDKQESSK